MIELHPTDKHTRTLLATNIEDPQVPSLEIAINYTGEASGDKAAPLDKKVIPSILRNNRIALKLVPMANLLLQMEAAQKLAPELFAEMEEFLKKEGLKTKKPQVRAFSSISCQGFEITVDDISNVLAKYHADSSLEYAQQLMDEVLQERADEIEEAALKAEVYEDDENTLNAQTAAAYEEIAEILLLADKIKATRCASSLKLTPDTNLVRVPETQEWVASENLETASKAAISAKQSIGRQHRK